MLNHYLDKHLDFGNPAWSAALQGIGLWTFSVEKYLGICHLDVDTVRITQPSSHWLWFVLKGSWGGGVSYRMHKTFTSKAATENLGKQFPYCSQLQLWEEEIAGDNSSGMEKAAIRNLLVFLHTCICHGSSLAKEMHSSILISSSPPNPDTDATFHSERQFAGLNWQVHSLVQQCLHYLMGQPLLNNF